MKRVLVSAVLITLCASACGGGSSKTSTVGSGTTPSASPSVSASASAGSVPSDTAEPSADPSFVSDAKVKAALSDFAALYVKDGNALKGVSFKPGDTTVPPQFAALAKDFENPKTVADEKVLTSYFTSGNCT
jgi:hypothetical protein